MLKNTGFLAALSWHTGIMDRIRRSGWRGWLAASLLLPLLVLVPQRGAAEEIPVDLELVIAVDVSVSMELEEQLLQRDGVMAAFRDPQVVEAIQRGQYGRIAVTYVEWSGSYLQWVRAPWTLVSDKASAAAFADKIYRAFFTRRYLTSMSGALLFTSNMFAGNGYDAPRQVIDISGDGPNNDGIPVDEARDKVVAQGITINGLPILRPKDDPLGFFEIQNLDRYYEECVIGGPGAFILPVRADEGIIDAVKRKLVTEIAGVAPFRPRRVRARYVPAVGVHGVDCQIGEKLLRQWWDSTEHE